MATTQKQIDRFRAGNVEAAEIILADAMRHGGEKSLMVHWARVVMQNLFPIGDTPQN